MKWFNSRRHAFLIAGALSLTAGSVAAQDNGIMVDPATGNAYRRRTVTVETPVTETKIRKENQTVVRPEVVTETTPAVRTVYTPVTEHYWEPKVHGRWNPFVAPTVAYHHVPRTRWVARQESVDQTQTRTRWVTENRTIEVPTLVTSMQRKTEVKLDYVGKASPKQALAASNPAASNPAAEIARRLRPLNNNEAIVPTSIAGTTFASPRIASGTIGRLHSSSTIRNESQQGIRTQELVPASQYARPLAPSSTLLR